MSKRSSSERDAEAVDPGAAIVGAKSADLPARSPRLERRAATAPRERDPVEYQPGDRVGRFVILRELGRGSTGIVYAAEDPNLRREVALKVLWGDDEISRKRFLREAQAAGGLTHSSIAAIYEVAEQDGVVFIAMELVRGRSLRAMLDERPPAMGGLPLEDALRIARQIGQALEKAHSRGIVHRDLKPENVMITEDGGVKLLDFGIAKFLERETSDVSHVTTLTEEGRILGTPCYMSPEQAKGMPVDVRTDVFSFGILLYEMLAGERPFKGKNPLMVLVAIDRDEPSPPSQKNPALPADVEQVVLRCLRKQPAERYANAGEVLRALEPKRAEKRETVPPAVGGALGPSKAATPDEVPAQRPAAVEVPVPGEAAAPDESPPPRNGRVAGEAPGPRPGSVPRKRRLSWIAIVAAVFIAVELIAFLAMRGRAIRGHTAPTSPASVSTSTGSLLRW